MKRALMVAVVALIVGYAGVAVAGLSGTAWQNTAGVYEAFDNETVYFSQDGSTWSDEILAGFSGLPQLFSYVDADPAFAVVTDPFYLVVGLFLFQSGIYYVDEGSMLAINISMMFFTPVVDLQVFSLVSTDWEPGVTLGFF